MRKMLSLLLAGTFGLLLAGAAQAGPLTSATLTFQIGTLPAAVFPGVGATGTATGSLSATLGAGTAFNATTTTTIPTTAAPPITQIQVILTKNGALSWANAPTTANFQGISNVKGLGGLTLLAVPLNIGTPFTFSKAAGGIAITAISAGWTAGATTITGVGNATTPLTAMATGSNGLVGGAGSLILITPVKIITNIAGTLAAFGVLTLNYVPEPGTLLLLGMGVAGLAAIGRRRM